MNPRASSGFIPFDCLGFANSPIGAKYLSQGNALGIMQQYLRKPRRGGIKVSKIILIIFKSLGDISCYMGILAPLRGFTIMVQVEGRAMPVLRLLKAYGLGDISLVNLN